jgi:glycosyltransferase involved in cell wall biosynthesis
MNKKKLKILVAICNYNHEKYLEQSIKSIQNQVYAHLDICVVDDGSTNKEQFMDIVSRLKKEDDRIRYIDLEKNYGKWYALNKAIETTDAQVCTAHDADDISLPDRIDMQALALLGSKTQHNLCGFRHCWSEEDVEKNLGHVIDKDGARMMAPQDVRKLVSFGFNHPSINHYYTGEFETAGVSAMFYKALWDNGLRFNPPGKGLRTLLSEDSDFNLRCTMFASTSILLEKPYLYRRNTSTNQEQM